VSARYTLAESTMVP